MAAARSPLAIHFGKRLRACRERVEISREELGFRASLHRTEIGMLERRERKPRLSTKVAHGDSSSGDRR